MSATSQSAPPTPERIFNAINSFQLTEAMKAALDLGIFTAIAEGATDAASIAHDMNASERGVRILCDYLTVKGFLNKFNGTYGLEQDSAIFLNRNSPAYVGSVANFMASDHHREAHRNIANAVRRGGCAVNDPFEPNDPIWVNFARHMTPMMRMSSENLAAALTKEAPVHKVLDIAAGHGLFGIAVARHNPEAQIYAVDWPKVLEVATENAQQTGVADRHHLIPGSAFDTTLRRRLRRRADHQLPPPLRPRHLHHLPPQGARIARSRRPRRNPRVRPQPRPRHPPTPAAFSLIMLASTPSGDAYTFAELASMAQAAGFSRVIPSDAPVMPEQLVIAYK